MEDVQVGAEIAAIQMMHCIIFFAELVCAGGTYSGADSLMSFVRLEPPNRLLQRMSLKQSVKRRSLPFLPNTGGNLPWKLLNFEAAQRLLLRGFPQTRPLRPPSIYPNTPHKAQQTFHAQSIGESCIYRFT